MTYIPWGNNQNLTEEQFYNRKSELNFMKSILKTTKDGTPPTILLTGIRGVGKTVFLRKIQRDLKENYIVIYIDFSQAECFKKNNMNIKGLLDHYFKRIITESDENIIKSISHRLDRFLKTNKLKIKDFSKIEEYIIPILGADTNQEELMEFVLTLPEKIYEDNKENIDGVLVFIDEFQIIRELNEYMDSFLWKLRSYIEKQRHVGYVFSGSMSLQDPLISEISSRNGVFGGKIISYNLNPFSEEITENYMKERVPTLNFTKDGFERFYKCTSGIPSYINIFAKLLPKNIELNEKRIIEEFEESIYYISSHLVNIWNKLSYREQSIILSLIDSPLKRIEIANSIGVKSGALSHYLINLQNLGLINIENNLYSISEPLLKKWLKVEYMRTGDYPYGKIPWKLKILKKLWN